MSSKNSKQLAAKWKLQFWFEICQDIFNSYCWHRIREQPATPLAAIFSAWQQPGWAQDPEGMHWLAKTACLKLCIQASEKGEMFPKALKQVNLLRLINNPQRSSSELVPYERESTERKGPQLRTPNADTVFEESLSSGFNFPEVFYKWMQDPWNKSVLAFGKYRQSTVSETTYTRWRR